jgi:hypothetical protein
MREAVQIFSEPELEFRYGQAVSDPRDGLSIFGAFDTDEASHPKNLSYAVVGTPGGIAAFKAFAARIGEPAFPGRDLDPALWPMFPGFEAAFACTLPTPTLERAIDESQLRADAMQRDEHKRAGAVVDRYMSAIELIKRRDEPVDVVICVVPDIVHQNCRPLSRVPGGTGERLRPADRQARQAGQTGLFDPIDPAVFQYSVDFRRQIKARAMVHELPIQIVRESTLTLNDSYTFGERRLTPLCDRAWNLSVALYYKAGGKPWRLRAARPGVCYLGLAYRRRDPTSRSPVAACAAQMFLDTGDGIVFMGEFGPWYSPERKQFHLSYDGARDLLAGALKTYADLGGQPLSELFLHCRSGIDLDEFAGFASACPAGIRLIGVRVRQERLNVRLYREGRLPVVRGTYWPIAERTAYLWSTGFKPRLGTYDGWETPLPLQIDIQHGDADVDQVASDIFGLTKLNYNACRLGEVEPVTVGFSDAVGEILVSNPNVKARSPKFKFYI